MHRNGISKIAVAAVTAALSLAVAASAHASPATPTSTPSTTTPMTTSAAPCHGAGCDDKDPRDMGCWSSARIVDSARTEKGTFHLMWSSRCKTNWVSVPDYHGGGWFLSSSLKDVNRGKEVSFVTNTNNGAHWSNMVYSPANNCTLARAFYPPHGSTPILKSSRC